MARGGLSALPCGTVDGHRSYPEESEPRWYVEERRYGDAEWDRRSEIPNDPLAGDFPSEEPTTRFRAEAIDVAALRRDASVSQSAAQPQAAPVPPPPVVAPVSPRIGGSLGQPPLGVQNVAGGPPPVPSQRQPSTGQGLGSPVEAGRGGLYHTRRAGLAFGLVAGTVALELPLLRALLASTLGDHFSVGGIVACALAMSGLPVLALGCYAASCGPATNSEPDIRAWARVPLAYVPIGLVLLLAAAVAAP